MSENVTEFLLSKLVASERRVEELTKALNEKTESMMFWYRAAKDLGHGKLAPGEHDPRD